MKKDSCLQFWLEFYDWGQYQIIITQLP
jgi:hypothetical protein